MTAIVGAITSTGAILVADRRLTRNGIPYEDESNKAVVLVCEDGRAAVSFTGLAELTPGGAQVPPGPPPPGYFATRWWLLDALEHSAAPDYELLPTIQRFCDRATGDFERLNVPKPSDKMLTVVFAGFSFEDPPRAFGRVASNFDGDQIGGFDIRYWWQEKEPGRREWHAVFAAGLTSAISAEDMKSLDELARSQASIPALMGRSISMIRKAADRSGGLIGKQCTSIVLPGDPRAAPVAGYHSADVAEQIHGVSLVVARRGTVAVFAEPELYVHGPGGSNEPLVPRVGRNKPCPCGSGKKYKKFHGSRRR